MKLDGYDIFTKNLTECKGQGITIYTASELKGYEISLQTAFDEHLSICVKLENDKKLAITCIYGSPSSATDNNNALCKLIKEIDNRPEHLKVILGDFNYPSITWNNLHYEATDNNESRDPDNFKEAIIESYLNQLVDSPTHARVTDNPCCIDWVFTNNEALINGVIDGSPLGSSDHTLIEVDTRGTHKSKEPKPSQRTAKPPTHSTPRRYENRDTRSRSSTRDKHNRTERTPGPYQERYPSRRSSPQRRRTPSPRRHSPPPPPPPPRRIMDRRERESRRHHNTPPRWQDRSRSHSPYRESRRQHRVSWGHCQAPVQKRKKVGRNKTSNSNKKSHIREEDHEILLQQLTCWLAQHASQPTCQKAAYPTCQKATYPTCQKAGHPTSTQSAKMQPNQPAKRQRIPPAKRQPTPPAKRQSTPPTKGQRSPPSKRQQTTHPEKKPTPPRAAPESRGWETMKWNKGQPAPAARKRPKHVKNKENKTKTNTSNKYQQVPPITMVATNQETTDDNKEDQQNEIMKHTEAAEKRIGKTKKSP